MFRKARHHQAYLLHKDVGCVLKDHMIRNYTLIRLQTIANIAQRDNKRSTWS